MPFGLGVPELIILLVIFLIIFGVGRLPQVGGAVGRTIREFRDNVREDRDTKNAASSQASEADETSDAS
ncbi:MAG: twin-arginine translocase TatA/TatE family subunit [Anaerolineae bacterium]